MTKQQILAQYLALHDALGSREDASDKNLFDQQHAQIWLDCDIALQTRKAYLEAQEPLTPQEQQELAELKALFPTLIQIEPIIFLPENPALGVEHRLSHVEQFLADLYPQP